MNLVLVVPSSQPTVVALSAVASRGGEMKMLSPRSGHVRNRMGRRDWHSRSGSHAGPDHDVRSQTTKLRGVSGQPTSQQLSRAGHGCDARADPGQHSFTARNVEGTAGQRGQAHTQTSERR